LGVRQVSNASTIITIPSSWQTSIISGEGGLCEVRKEFTPMLFMIFICRTIASRLTAAPSAPRSWCRSTPRSLVGSPFTNIPSTGSIVTQRTPNRFSTASTGRRPAARRVSSV